MADRDAPFVPTAEPGCALACERKMPLTRRSTLGTVYEASPRTLVCQGSVALQLVWPSTMPAAVIGTAAVPSVGALGRPNRAVISSHVLFTPWPVLVPP